MRRSLTRLNTTLMLVLFLTTRVWAQAADSSGVSLPDSAATSMNAATPDSVPMERPVADTVTTAKSNPDSMQVPPVAGPLKIAVVVQD